MLRLPRLIGSSLQLLVAVCSITSSVSSPSPALRIAFAPHPFLSHWAVSAPIAHQLLERGHHVLFAASTEDQHHSFNLTGHPNATFAIYKAPYSESHLRETINGIHDHTGFRGSPTLAVLMTFFDVKAYSDAMLTDKKLIQQVQEFGADLFVADPGNLGGWALADLLHIPKAIIQVPGFHPPLDADLYGHGSHAPTYIPTFGSVLPSKMTLGQRCWNVARWLVIMSSWRGFINWFGTVNVWTKHNIPPYSYRESGRSSKLVLVNSHFALATPRPLGPKVHVVGALTAKAPQPLPADLEAFMQQAGPSGVVYASLGYTAIPERGELREVANALGAIAPVQVLWKLTAADQAQLGIGVEPGDSSKSFSPSWGLRPGVGSGVGAGNATLPSNIRLIEWAPQNDVLGHPAVRAFLTQAGTNSFNEAAYHGVPIVGMPLWGEQPDNVARAVEQGFGAVVSIDDTQNLARDLQIALHRVLGNPSFAGNASRVSKLVQATRQSPASQAADWVEHAAWTKDSNYLDTPSSHMTWAQQMLLDVLGIYIGLGVISILAVKFGTVAYQLHRKHLKVS